MARPWKVTSAQVDPASIVPRKVNFPVQSPPRPPTALKLMSVGDEVLVMPGCWVVTPVGAKGVPPHVHVFAADADVAPASAAMTVRPLAQIHRNRIVPRLLVVVEISLDRRQREPASRRAAARARSRT